MVPKLIFLTGCVMSLSGCPGARTTQLLVPSVPTELRTPVPVPDREAENLKDVGLLLVDYDEALGEANSKIVATDEILARAEERAARSE